MNDGFYRVRVNGKSVGITRDLDEALKIERAAKDTIDIMSEVYGMKNKMEVKLYDTNGEVLK